MGMIGTKLRAAGTDTDKRIMFWCPGCNQPHVIRIYGASSPAWEWDGNVEFPTFNPSILVTTRWSKLLEPGDDPKQWQDEICHSFVRNGNIQFLGDCTHSLKNQTVPLPAWPENQSC